MGHILISYNVNLHEMENFSSHVGWCHPINFTNNFYYIARYAFSWSTYNKNTFWSNTIFCTIKNIQCQFGVLVVIVVILLKLGSIPIVAKQKTNKYKSLGNKRHSGRWSSMNPVFFVFFNHCSLKD